MFNLNILFDPDYGQNLDYHQELLAKAGQERLVQQARLARGRRPTSRPFKIALKRQLLHLVSFLRTFDRRDRLDVDEITLQPSSSVPGASPGVRS